MKNNKMLRYFEVKRPVGRVLSWSLAGFLVLTGLIFVGDYIGNARISDGWLTYGISRITQSRVGEVLFSLASAGCLLVIYEHFRRCFVRAKSVLSFLVLAIMALIGCETLLSLIPAEHYGLPASPEMMTHWSTFADRFRNSSELIINVLQFVLAFFLCLRYRGRIVSYAIASVVCPLVVPLIFVVSLGWYDHYGQGDFYRVGMILLDFAFTVLPVILLRRTMKHVVIHESGDHDLTHL